MLLLLLACHVHQDFDCVTDEREVADDEALGDLAFTVGDLTADLAGVRTFPVSLRDGTIVGAELSLARADVPALFLDKTWESHDVIRPGLFDSTNLMYVSCDDSVEVPFELALTTADGSVDIAGEADATDQRWGDTTQGVGGVSIDGAVGGDGLITPLGSGGGAALNLAFDGPELFQVSLGDASVPTLLFPPEGEE
ncbi:MAG: hypothetical protein Q8P18_13790 [Pseudomonadota bacterium]|nr:hypothetical protein [Pseudomonadota bacterium]